MIKTTKHISGCNDYGEIHVNYNSYSDPILVVSFENDDEYDEYHRRIKILDKKVLETFGAFFVQCEALKNTISSSDRSLIENLVHNCNSIFTDYIRGEKPPSQLKYDIQHKLNDKDLKSIIASSDSQWMLIRLIENMMTALGEFIKDSFSLANNPFRFYKTVSEEKCDAFRDSVISLDEKVDVRYLLKKLKREILTSDSDNEELIMKR